MTCVLTDIEGTTSSISFVKEVLFPYAAAALPEFIRQQAQRPEIAALIAAIQQECALSNQEAVIQQCLTWITADEKNTALKQLQGYIWQLGYENGDYQAHVYADSYSLLQHWQQIGIPLYVYSSGSLYAQDLFFHYSCFGDIRGLFAGNFDTTTGAKQSVNSYQKIATRLIDNQVVETAAEIVFLSDVIEELDAAQDAGMQTWHLQRSAGMASSQRHSIARDFIEIHL